MAYEISEGRAFINRAIKLRHGDNQARKDLMSLSRSSQSSA